MFLVGCGGGLVRRGWLCWGLRIFVKGGFLLSGFFGFGFGFGFVFFSIFVDLQSLSYKVMASQFTMHLRKTGSTLHHTHNRSDVTDCSCKVCSLQPLCSAWLQNKGKHVASENGQS